MRLLVAMTMAVVLFGARGARAQSVQECLQDCREALTDCEEACRETQQAPPPKCQKSCDTLRKMCDKECRNPTPDTPAEDDHGHGHKRH